MFDNYICVLPVLTREDTCMSIEILCQLRFSYERPFASHMEGKDGGHSAAVILNSESKRTDNRHKSRLHHEVDHALKHLFTGFEAAIRV
jgi:hypothetical protein